jgi:predicted ATP-grasp superfamily ATP-dependent carboligase
MRAAYKKWDTFQKFKKFVTERFCGQYNAFQRVSMIFDIDFNDKYHVYATKLNEELQSSIEAIREHYFNIDNTKELSAEMKFYRERIENVTNSGSFWTGNHNDRNRQNRKTGQNFRDKLVKQPQSSNQTDQQDNRKYVTKKPETAQSEINDIAETFHSVIVENRLFQ